MKNIDKRNVIWNIIGSTFSAFNSLFFTIIVTRINGINDAGIFAYCFATACLLYFIANYCGRAFQVTDITGKNSDTDYIYNRIITCIVMLVIALAFTLVKGYDIYKTTIFILLCVFKCLEAFSEVLYAVIQRNQKLYKVGISLFVKAILGVIVFGVVNYITGNLVLSCIALIIANIVVILTYDTLNLRKVELVKTIFSKEANNRIFKTGLFTFVLTFLSTYLINTSRYAIDDLLTNDIQTIFGIIIMPATFMGVIGQYIIQPVLIKLAEAIKQQKYEDLKNIVLKIVTLVLVLGVLVFAVAYVLEVPVLELVYAVELKPYFISMMIIILGSIFYTMNSILSTILIAMRKTLGQAIVYGIVALISTFIAYYMVDKYYIIGASVTYIVTMVIVTIVFSIFTVMQMNKYKKLWKNS